MIAIVKCQNSYWIGRTSNVDRTMSLMKDANPFEISLVTSVEVESEASALIAVNSIVKLWNVHGRWFNLSPTDLRRVMETLQAMRKPAPKADAKVLTLGGLRAVQKG